MRQIVIQRGKCIVILPFIVPKLASQTRVYSESIPVQESVSRGFDTIYSNTQFTLTDHELLRGIINFVPSNFRSAR